MKKIIFALSCAFVLLSSSCKEEQKTELNVMSFNLRLDAKSDSLNNWQYRKAVAGQIVTDKSIDVLGVQEALSNQMEDMKAALPDYSWVGVGREDGIANGEFSAIFYKKDKFKSLKSGTFWLSETPDVAGSMGWDAACTRVATWTVLEDIANQRKIFVINTHLDHVGKVARIEGVTLMLQKAIEEAKGLPLIITGDFNSTPDSDVIAHIKKQTSPKVLLAREIAENSKDKKGTFHDFGRNIEGNDAYIDYIFVSDAVQVLFYEVVDEKLGDVYLSDHNPIWAKVLY